MCQTGFVHFIARRQRREKVKIVPVGSRAKARAFIACIIYYDTCTMLAIYCIFVCAERKRARVLTSNV